MKYRELRIGDFDRAMVDVRAGDDRVLVSLFEALLNDVEGARIDLRQETSNRKDVARRKRVGESKAKRGLSENACIALYMVAGPLLIPPHDYSEGQVKRLGTLILDVLSEPHRYGARLIRDLGRTAVEP